MQGNVRRGKVEKNLIKLILGKEEKGFDAIECHDLKDNTIDKKYLNSLPLGFALVKNVLVLVEKIKKAPP
jgi:hypothetical protein